MNYKHLLKIILLYFINCFPQGFEEDFNFEHISIEEGLSSSTVNSIIQDKKGFLWIATENGLNRYDGYTFEVYRNNPEDSLSLSHNFIWSLAEDNNGFIWIATDGGGLNKFDPATEKFIRYNYDENDGTSLGNDIVQYVFVDNKNILWIGTWEGGLNKYDQAKNNFKRYLNIEADKTSLPNNKIFSIYEDRKNNLWVATDGGGVSILNRENDKFKSFIHDEKNPNSLISNNIISIHEDSRGYMWFGAYGSGASKYDPVSNTFSNYKNSPRQNSFNGETIWKIVEDHRGLLWIGTLSKGINIYDYRTNTFKNLSNDPYNPFSLSTDYIRTMFEDRSGNLWVGTMTGGLNKVDRKQKAFFNLKKDLNNTNSLSDNSISAICADKNGDIWFGTYNKGLIRYNTDENKFLHYFSNPANPKSLHGELVKKIYEDKSGKLWIGTYFSVLNSYDDKSNSFMHYDLQKHGFAEGVNNIRTIFEDKEGNYWFGINGGGILKYDSKENSYKKYSTYDTSETVLSNDYVICICEDEENNLWIGTYGGGLNKFNIKEGKFSNYIFDQKNKNSISDNVVTDLLISKSGDLWAATYSGGLNKYKKETDSFIRYREKNGLPSDFICAVLEDGKQNLWLSTGKGISKFNPRNKLFRNYDYSDGVQKGEFNPGAAAKTKSGWMYFGGVNGVTYFHPDSLKDNPLIPQVVISSIKINNEEIDNIKNSSYLDSITLSYNDNSFSFEFASLDFTHPKKNEYAYKLEGLDDDWNDSGNRRFANYTHLDPGEYIFKVKGTNNNGVWNEIPTSVFVMINPPFWGTWWFRGIAIFTFLSVGPIIYFRRVSVLKKEKAAQEEFSKQLINSQEDERKRIASELHDSLGQDLLIIKNLALLGLKKKEDVYSIKQLEEISKTSSATIEEVRQIAYNLHPYQLDRLGLTKAIKSIITQVSGLTKINFVEKIDEVDNLFSKENEINIFRIVQECINNIIKHSNASKAEIIIFKEDNTLVIRISDDGKGFDSKKVYNQVKGFGMKNLMKRVSILNGEIDINSFPGRGTTIIIKVKSQK